MDKKKLIAIKDYIDDVSPLPLGAMFWFGILYIVELILSHGRGGHEYLLRSLLICVDILSVVYGYQYISIRRKSKQKLVKKHGLIKWVLTIILCVVINIIYCHYTKLKVIAVNFLLSQYILLVYYFFLFRMRKK